MKDKKHNQDNKENKHIEDKKYNKNKDNSSNGKINKKNDGDGGRNNSQTKFTNLRDH